MSEQPQDNPVVTVMMLLAGIGLTVVIIGLFYRYYGYIFEGTWATFRIMELYVWWGLSHILHWVGLSPTPDEINSQIEWLKNPPGGIVSSKAKSILMAQWTAYWTWLLPFLVIPPSLIMMLKGNSTRLTFTKKSLDSLLLHMSKMYPNLETYVKDNPQDFPLDYKAGADNRFAMRTIPFELAMMSPPPGWEKHPDKECRNAPPIFDPTLAKGDRFDGDLCEKYLCWQVGPRFKGLKHMSSAERRLFNFFKGKIPSRQRGKIKEILNSHAYTRPILMSMYFEVQSLGSCPTEMFKWLRYEDRWLWYAMTDVGEETPSAESLGSWYHWTMETSLGMPIPEPAVELARLSLQKMVDVEDEFLEEVLEARDKLMMERKTSGLKYRRDKDFIKAQKAQSKSATPKSSKGRK